MPQPGSVIEFPPFRLDRQDERLWRGKRPIALRPKTYAVICYLAERPGVLVTRDELMDAIWPGVAVAPDTLSQSIRELRRALGDDARAPRFVETVHGRGFRFRAQTHSGPSFPVSAPDANALEDDRRARLPGRDAELKRIEELLADAERGHRRLVFVTGEPGIGKSRLLRECLDRLALRETVTPLCIARGDCAEQLGEIEPYAPVFEALDRLAREDRSLKDLLRSTAPSWLVQLPWLLDDEESNALMDRLAFNTQARMLREFGVAVEAFAVERTLVLCLEDLHWSDPSTIDLLYTLARRTEPARLLVVCTFRPVDAAMNEHPVRRLKRRLLQEGLATELALEYLDEAAIEEYLCARFGELRGASDLAGMIHEQTQGNPLFMVSFADHVLAEGWLERIDDRWELTRDTEELRSHAPESLRSILESRLEELGSEDRLMLEAASAVGVTFTSQPVAAALEIEIESVERICSRLANWQFLLECAGPVQWPDGSTGQGYRFLHVVFRRMLYERVPAARIQQIHRRIGDRLEAAFSSQPDAPASQLALHFQKGGEPARAVDWLVRNAAQVKRRFADREAIVCLEAALKLLARLPEDDRWARRELEIRFDLARALQLAVSYNSEELQPNLARARELCDRLDDRRGLALILNWQSRGELVRGRPAAVRSIVELQRRITPYLDDRSLSMQTEVMTGMAALLEGALAEAESQYLQVSRALADVNAREALEQIGHDPGTVILIFGGVTAWLQGEPQQARQRADAGCRRARESGDPLGTGVTLTISSLVEYFRRDQDAVRALDSSLAAHTNEYGLGFPYTSLYTTRGWLLAQEGDLEGAIATLREGAAAAHAAGTALCMSILLGALAGAQLAQAATREGLATIEEALAFVETSGERFWEAELHRLHGEILLKDLEAEPAENAFRKALEVSRSQGARSLELRAATSLARLCHGGSRQAEAHASLQTVYAAFEEGFDTADLRDANSVLALP